MVEIILAIATIHMHSHPEETVKVLKKAVCRGMLRHEAYHQLLKLISEGHSDHKMKIITRNNTEKMHPLLSTLRTKT